MRWPLFSYNFETLLINPKCLEHRKNFEWNFNWDFRVPGSTMLKPLSEILAWKFFLATPWMRLPKWLSKWAKLCLSSKTSSSKSTLSSPFKNLTEIEVKWSHNLWSQKAINLQYLFSSRNCTKTKIFSFKKKTLHTFTATLLVLYLFVSFLSY